MKHWDMWNNFLNEQLIIGNIANQCFLFLFGFERKKKVIISEVWSGSSPQKLSKSYPDPNKKEPNFKFWEICDKI